MLRCCALTRRRLHPGALASARFRAMNRLGMLIDLAHGTLEDVRAAVEVSTKPMIARSNQVWFASPRTEKAEATRPPSKPGVMATAPSTARAKAEIMSCVRQMVIRERSLFETQHLASG